MATVQQIENAGIRYVNATGFDVDRAVLISLDGSETAELRHILTIQLTEFLELFLRKNAEYGENAQTLGAKGQFADIWRKIGKLRTGLWEDQEHRLTSESVDEILRDLIGHCLLTLTIRAREREAEAEATFADANEPFMGLPTVLPPEQYNEVIQNFFGLTQPSEAESADREPSVDRIEVGTTVFWNNGKAIGQGLDVVAIDPSRENGRILRVRNKHGEEGWVHPQEVHPL